MLIQFSLANFRSFREEQTFSMVAAPRIGKKENKFKAPINEKFPELLKVAVIYGPNASGKSNLLKGLLTLVNIAKREPSNIKTSIPVQSFAFDSELINEPSRFEIHFIANNMRYEFILFANQERIIKEELTSFPNGVEKVLYKRNYNKDNDSYNYEYKEESGNELLINIWKKITPKDVLFISQIISNNENPDVQLLSAFTWLTTGLTCHLEGAKELLPATKKLMYSDVSGSEQIRKFFSNNLSDFLRDFDIPISSIDYEEKKEINIAQVENNTYKPTKEVYFTHDTKSGKYRISFDDQSDGTQSLVSFFVPWMYTQLSDNACGNVLVVDELDSSLHPLIVEALVKKHINKTNSTSQIIFTTHDTHLMNSKIIRRDQIWITDRDAYGASKLSCIHEYEGREGEDVEKRYYEGRYKGLPQRRSK